ncbi:MAG: sulfite exporter TauE/SafE family protein, partial [Rhodocyclaceae bacterium]|nr:sulfite exporter TauE/SafE family protein [Rhodocyclaceae bacterium]
SDTAHLRFDGVRVPADNLIGEEGQGFRIVMRNFNAERLSMAALAVGFAEACLAEALAWLERGGQGIWQRIQPLTARFLPVRGVAQALPLGLLWGWLPCGLVYSALPTALAAGSAGRGALAMLAFGLGTLPNLLMAGLLLARFRRFAQARLTRLVSGGLVLGYGLYGLYNIARSL